MVDKVSFFTPIVRGDPNSSQFRAVEGFDNYFAFGGKRCQVIKSGGYQASVKQIDDYRSHIALDIAKVLSYLTVLVPLIMLVGKAIARAQYDFVKQQEAPIPSTVINVGSSSGTVALLPIPSPKGVVSASTTPTGIQYLSQPKPKSNPTVTPLEYTIKTLPSANIKPIRSLNELAATKIQAAMRGFLQRKEYAKQKEVAITLQAKLRGKKVRQEFLKQKEAATKIQAAMRGFRQRKEYTKQKEAATKIQAAMRGFLQRKEYSKQKEAVVKMQAALRGKKVRQEYVVQKEALRKKKLYLIKNIQEILETERNFGEDLQRHADMINDSEFKNVLKYSKDERELAELGEKYQELVRMNQEVMAKLEPLVPQRDDLNLMDLRENVQEICKLLQGEEFEQYMEKLLEVSRFQTRYDEMVNESKVEKFRRRKRVQIFEPCFIPAQRLMRYPMMLGDTHNFAGKMEIESEKSSIDQTREKCDSFVKKYNLCIAIEEAKKILADNVALAPAETKLGAVGQFFAGAFTGRSAKVKKLKKDITNFLNGRKIFQLRPPSNESELSSEQLEMQQLERQLLEIDLVNKEEAATALIKKTKRDQDDRLALQFIADEIDGIHPDWIASDKQIELQALIKLCRVNSK